LLANFLEAVKVRRSWNAPSTALAKAGNASLEELVMALHVRRQYFNHIWDDQGVREALTNIDTRQILQDSRLVSI